MKHILSLLCILTCGTLSHSQDTALQWRVQYAYKNLSTFEISSGILIDRTLQFVNHDQFRGMPDSTCMNGEWEQLYLEICKGSYKRETP